MQKQEKEIKQAIKQTIKKHIPQNVTSLIRLATMEIKETHGGALPRGWGVQIKNEAKSALPLLEKRLAEKAEKAEKARRQRRRRWEKTKGYQIDLAVREAYSKCEYRKSRSSWAGGYHSLSVEIIEGKKSLIIISQGSLPAKITFTKKRKPGCSGDSEKVYSSNGKWRGKNSLHKIRISRDYLDIPEEIRALDGILTLAASPLDQEGMYSATWAVSGRGFEIYPQEGYIYFCEGVGVHGRTPQGAKKTHKRRMNPLSSDEKAAKAEKKQALVQEGWEALIAGDDHPLLEGRVVTVSHCKRAGLCLDGIEEWCRRHLPDAIVPVPPHYDYHGLDRHFEIVPSALWALGKDTNQADLVESAIRACLASPRPRRKN